MLKRIDRPPPDPLFWRGMIWAVLLTASVAFIVGMLFA
jgi:hypothetical protein